MKNYLFSSLLISSLIFFCCNKELVINKPSLSIGKLPSPGELADLFNQQGLILNVSQSDFKLSARSESTGFCEPEAIPGYNCQIYNFQTTVDVSPTFGCPGCDDVLVFFKLQICQNPNPPYNKVLNFFDLGINYCPDVADCWSSLANNLVSQAIDAFEYAASIAIESKVINGLFQSGFLNAICGLDVQVSSTFIRQSCYMVCEVQILQYPFYEYSTAPCGVKCCKRTTLFCKNNDVIEASEPTFTQIGSSDCEIGLWPECQGTIISCYDAPCGPL